MIQPTFTPSEAIHTIAALSQVIAARNGDAVLASAWDVLRSCVADELDRDPTLLADVEAELDLWNRMEPPNG